MSSIEDIKAKAQELVDTINAFQPEGAIAAPAITAEEVVKVETEVAAIDAELKADETV